MRRRFPRVLAAAVVTGFLVGVVVFLFEQAVHYVEVALEEVPIGVRAFAPMAGLAGCALMLRYIARDPSPSTSDEYVKAFHDRVPHLPLRVVPGRLLAGVSTVGSGGALGLEGPAIFAGSTIGWSIQQRFHGLFAREESKLLITAGAAAGVAAIFKTPATGVLFALEAPYFNDVARRALLPALLASATSYITFVTLIGDTDPVLEIGGSSPRFNLVEVAGALAVGVLAGLSARSFSRLVAWAKGLAHSVALPVRIVVAGLVLAGLAFGAEAAFGEPLTLGPGVGAVDWATETAQQDAFTLVALLLAMRICATIATLGGGGAGGVFIPLAVQGVLLGRLVSIGLGSIVSPDDLDPASALYPTLGLAAFLGAGYRTPMASVMFVAESTGASQYVVPALVASAVAQLVVGSTSVSKYQRNVRLGHLERRFTLSITTVLNTEVLTVPPDATLAEFVYVHAIGRRALNVPVVENGRYLGMCGVKETSTIDREEWDTVTVGEITRNDLPSGRPSWSLRDAVAAMEDHDIDVLAVTDAEGLFIGVVSESEILRLDEILDETGG